MPFDFSRILNSHKNKILETTRTSGFPLDLLETTEEGLTFSVSLKGSSLKFIITQNSEDYERLSYQYSKFEPGFPKYSAGNYGIDLICREYKDWLSKHVAKHMEFESIPDLWAEVKAIQPMISSKSFTQEDFEMFTEREKFQIQESLKEFQRLIKEEISPMKESLDNIQEKLDYLSNAVNKLNRFDWKGVALSTVIGIATNLSVDTNSGKQVFDLFQQAFQALGSTIRLLPK